MTTRRPCAGPWKTPAIDSKGNLTVCCHDKALNYKLGNLSNSNFDELWFGAKAESIRKAHILGQFDKLGKMSSNSTTCASCNGLDSPVISDVEILSYLEQIGCPELKRQYLDRVCKGWNRIETLLVEITDECNLNCIMCRQQEARNHSRKGQYRQNAGFMELDVWKSILNDVLESGLQVKALTPFWYGEPFLHPQFFEMLRYAFQLNRNEEYDRKLEAIEKSGNLGLLKSFLEVHPFSNRVFDYMEIHTNGQCIRKEMLEYLFSDEATRSLGYIVFSIDAFKEETYNKIRRGGNFKRLYETIMHALRLKRDLFRLPHNQMRKSVRPVIVLQFIVMPENHQEAEQFVDYWKARFDSMGIPCQINAGYEPPFIKDTIFLRVLGDIDSVKQPEAWELHSRVISNSKHFKRPKAENKIEMANSFRRPCAAPWKTPVIRWDGTLGVCCYDWKMELALGNVKKLKLSWLWNMDTLLNLRLAHARGELTNIHACRGCPTLNNLSINDEEIVEYLKNIGKPNEILPYLRRVNNYELIKSLLE